MKKFENAAFEVKQAIYLRMDYNIITFGDVRVDDVIEVANDLGVEITEEEINEYFEEVKIFNCNC